MTEIQPKGKKAELPTPMEQPAPKSSSLGTAIEVFRALGFALSARAILLLAIVGAFVLAVMAMLSQTQEGLFVLVAYSCLTVIPAMILEIKRRV